MMGDAIATDRAICGDAIAVDRQFHDLFGDDGRHNRHQSRDFYERWRSSAIVSPVIAKYSAMVGDTVASPSQSCDGDGHRNVIAGLFSSFWVIATHGRPGRHHRENLTGSGDVYREASRAK
jgi:hypothetical protein